MQRRIFVIIFVILGILTLVGVIFAVSSTSLLGGGDTTISDPTTGDGSLEIQEPTGEPMVEVIVAAQPIARGSEFLEGSLTTRLFSLESAPDPELVIQSVSETFGKIASQNIVQSQPIYRELLRDRTGSPTGEAAFDIPTGHVMVAFPIDKQTSVAYAVKPGDIVDILMTFSVVDIDPEFQTVLPNKFSFLLTNISENSSSVGLSEPIDEGRLAVEIPEFPGVEFPREDQRPRRVAQLIVQKASIIGVGPWLELEPTPIPAEGEEGTAPAPEIKPPDIVSLAVTPQDALVLLWARSTGIYMEMALRAAGDADAYHSTEAVTLQYMLTRFNISIPPKIEFAIDKDVLPTPTPEPNTGNNRG